MKIRDHFNILKAGHETNNALSNEGILAFFQMITDTMDPQEEEIQSNGLPESKSSEWDNKIIPVSPVSAPNERFGFLETEQSIQYALPAAVPDGAGVPGEVPGEVPPVEGENSEPIHDAGNQG